MRLLSGRLTVAAGIVLAVAALLVFSLAGPTTTVGQETDVALPTDEGPAQPPASLPDGDADAGAEGPAAPPASLPDTGNGGYLEAAGSPKVLLMTLLAALGVTLAGAGAIAARNGRRVRGE